MEEEIDMLKKALDENEKLRRKQKKLLKIQEVRITELSEQNEKLKKKNEYLVNALDVDKETSSRS